VMKDYLRAEKREEGERVQGEPQRNFWNDSLRKGGRGMEKKGPGKLGGGE